LLGGGVFRGFENDEERLLLGGWLFKAKSRAPRHVVAR